VTVSYATHRERRFELWIKLDRLLHGIIVQLVCKHDTPNSVECARGQVIDEQVVGRVNDSGGDVHTDAPVVRVIFPNDRLQTQRMGNCANAVLEKEKRCRYPNVLKRDEETRRVHQYLHREGASRSG
jgi:hypothetical protein